MSFRHVLALLALVLSGCSPQQPVQPDRDGVLVPENQTGDPALNWLGPAYAALASEPHRWPMVASVAEAQAAGITQLWQGQYTKERGQLVLRLVRYGLASRRVQVQGTVQVPAGSGPEVLRQLRQALAGTGLPAITVDDGRLAGYRAFGLAHSALTPADALQHLGVAAHGGGPAAAWRELVDLQLAQRDWAAAWATIQAARGQAISAADRAALERLAFQIHQTNPALGANAVQYAEALERAARSAPDEPDLWRELGQVALNVRRYSLARAAWERVVQVRAEDTAAWNQLAYARAYAGDAPGALQALDRYRQLAPRDANQFDSRGELLYRAGRFAEAEQAFREALRLDAGFNGGDAQRKAAWSRLRRGDRAGAEQLWRAFLTRSRAPLAALEFEAVFGGSNTLEPARQLVAGRRPAVINAGGPGFLREVAQASQPGSPVFEALAGDAQRADRGWQNLVQERGLAPGVGDLYMAIAAYRAGNKGRAREFLRGYLPPATGADAVWQALLLPWEQRLRAELAN